MTFSFRSIGEIREGDMYTGYRVSLSVNYPPMAFPLKLETVISRGDQNTRPRDYYDIYILTKLQYSNIESYALKTALNATTEKRGSRTVVKDYHRIIDTVRSSDIMKKHWGNYQKDFEYATDIAFEDVCDAAVQLMDSIMKNGN